MVAMSGDVAEQSEQHDWMVPAPFRTIAQILFDEGTTDRARFLGTKLTNTLMDAFKHPTNWNRYWLGKIACGSRVNLDPDGKLKEAPLTAFEEVYLARVVKNWCDTQGLTLGKWEIINLNGTVEVDVSVTYGV